MNSTSRNRAFLQGMSLLSACVIAAATGVPAFGQNGGVAGAESVVYRNTTSTLLFPPGADRRIADDLILTELCGCRLTRYSVTLGGGGDGTGPGFTADVAMYDGCPNNGGVIIPGTELTVNAPDDGDYQVELDVSSEFIDVPGVVWLAVEFNRAGAGWYAGDEPSTGFSDNVYDFPGFACSAVIGAGFYASFAAEVNCTPPGPPDVDLPLPGDGATNVSPNIILAWNGGEPGQPVTGNDEGDLITPDDFVDGTVHPDEALAQMQAAIDGGEIPDPATIELPAVEPRSYFGPDTTVAGFEVPQVTASDIFAFEDTDDILVQNFSSGQLYALMASATNAVLAEHGDNFDFVAFFLNFAPHHQIGAAFYLGLENDVSGLGMNTFNNRPGFGITGNNVEGWVMMWNQNAWGPGSDFTKLVLGQEFEHRFGMYLNPLPGNRPLQGNNGSCGRSGHWNFRVDGQGSGMEIAEWVGSSPAVRVGGTLNYCSDIPDGVFSYPDLYLMGYVPGSEMDSAASELRYMDNNTSCNNSYNGTISTFTSSDIVATNGTRSPSFVSAQKHFSTAWVMLHRPGSPPNASQLNNVVNILNTWSNVWLNSTLGRGTMSNVLNPVEPQLCQSNYDVFIDTQNPPNTLVCDDITNPTCDPGTLSTDETYFWQVIASDEKGTTNGPVWSFTTAPGGGPDCNNNGVPDSFDIADGVSEDCNFNGIPDECEDDADLDGVIDDCDVCPGGDDTVDGDGDGAPDACDPCPVDNPDDVDGDGVCNSDDACPNGDDTVDTDGDGTADHCDVCPLDEFNDSDGDGHCDSDDICPGGDDDIDGDGDGIPDDCDDCPVDNPNDPDGDGVCTSDDNCDLANPSQVDCQPNGIGDACDINDGTSMDTNGNGVPDECEKFAPAPPLAEDSLATGCKVDGDCANASSCIGGTCYVPKNRHLSVLANAENAGTNTARRIRLDLGGSTLDLGWIGAPQTLTLAGPEDNPVLVAPIVASPVYVDWTTLDDQVVHVGACAISPGHTYLVDEIREGQDTGQGTSFSTTVALPTTAVWADVVGNTGSSSPPDGTVSFVDVQAVVFGFQSVQNVSKIWLELEGTGMPHNVPDVTSISFADILRAVGGFQGNPYPFSAPGDCP